MAYENYTIRQFMNAMFNDDRTVMTEDQYNEVYTEYIDTAGLYESEEFEKVAYIHFISNRVNSVKMGIRLQKEFIINFGGPYIEGLKFFRKFGYTIYWNNKIDDIEEKKNNFIDQLSKIEIREKKYISELEICIKNLTDSRSKKINKEPELDKKESRGQFIRTLNSLGKIGYKIDNDKTTVEELSHMIKQQFEENK